MSGSVFGNLVQAQSIADVTIEVPAPPKEIPNQLPPAPARFVNRSRELDRLNDFITARSGPAGPKVVVVSGMTGVGKSAFGLHLAHRHRHQYNGGLLYADLSVHRNRGAVAVSDVLGTFLRALGLHPHYIPPTLGERTTMFRTLSSSAPMLVLVDDADQAAQIRPLLPGNPDGLVVVTSQRKLSGLTMEGAELVELLPFDSSDGVSLVAQMVSAERLDAEKQATRELVQLCAGLPIALRVAGARLANRRQQTIANLVEYLGDDARRLERLLVEGEPGVSEVFDDAYLGLPDSVKKLYQCLGLHPGAQFSVPVLVAGTKTAPAKIDRLLGALVDANLVDDVGSNRYRVHELVRLHARFRAEREQTSIVRSRILRRYLNWYLTGAANADRAVLGTRWRLAKLKSSGWDTIFDPASAMGWYESERENLLEAVRAAARSQWYDIVWKLCEALWAYYYSRKHHADWIESHELGVAAARHINDRLVETRMLNQLARAHLELREYETAAAELDRALAAANASGERQAEAVVHESRGILARERGMYPDAIEAFEKSLRINEIINDKRGVALESYHLGDVLSRAGQHDRALAVLRAALRTVNDISDEMTAGRIQIVLGSVYCKLGRMDEARDALRAAMNTMRERKQLIKEAQALEQLIVVAQQTRDDSLERSSVARLKNIYQETGSPVVVLDRGEPHREKVQGDQ